MKATIKKLAMAFAAMAATVGFAGDSAPFLLDTAEGKRIAQEGEAILVAYSPHWNGAANCTVAETGRAALVAGATDEGSVTWTPQGVGAHTLTHTAGGETLTAQFAVLGDDVVLHGGNLAAGETWGTNKVHLITTALTVPSGVSLTLEPGAVVKFTPDASLTVASGGGCTARGVIFTHMNDDTVGGDTLCDGEGAQPVMGDYTIAGSITDDDSTEYRYMPPQTLTSSISSNTRLRGYRTYIVSNSVTVASGATLTLQPGTILKFNTGCQLTVNGTLDAQGTRAAPIVFTSLKDDEHGGDANGDGEKTRPTGGDWRYIYVSGTANLKYCKAMYGAPSNETGILETTGSGVLKMDCCYVAHALYDGIWNWGGSISVKNTVITDTGWATAPYRGSKNEYINCVIFGNNVGLCYWSNWNGSTTYRNCIFAECVKGWCELGSNSYGDPSSRVSVSNCLFWNPVGFGVQSCGIVGSNGNIWGDPLFVDPDNGDFRIAVNSPCVDAGDGMVAPETDYYGQPRDGEADIGIYEVIGSHLTGYDLAAVAVNAQAARSTIGETLTITYDIANIGRLAVAEQWHDALYLVSASSGKSYLLGEILNPGALGSGETRTYTSQFKLPVVPMGEYSLRLVVNSRRMDVPEGQATENNSVLSEAKVEVVSDSIDISAGASGSVAAGASAVCEIAIPAGAGDKLLRIKSVAGGATLYARCGLGFLPVDASSGVTLSFSGGETWLSVPAGTEKVWLVLDNEGATAASYEVDSHDGSLALVGVSPSNIPSSGEVTLEISGAGFTDGCEASFAGAGTVAPLAVRRVSSGLLAATVDAAAFSAGGVYSVAVKKGAEVKRLDSALTVATVPGEPKFWAKLDVPSSMRQGRLVSTCFIEYGNSGTADMLAPVVQVSLTGDGTLGYIDGLSGLKTLQFVAAGDAGSAGVLRPGSSHRIRFAVRAGASNKISLHTSEGSTYAPEPWTNAADYLADLSAAATRIGLRGQDATDYVTVFDLAKVVKNGEPSSAICGRVVDENGEGVEGLSITITNETDTATCSTDGKGRFVSGSLGAGHYAIYVNGCISKTLSDVEILGNDDVSLSLKIVVNSQLVVPVPEGEVVDDIALRVVRVSDGSSDFTMVRRNDGIHCIGLDKGAYLVMVETPSSKYSALSLISEEDDVVSVDLVKAIGGSVSGVLSGGYDPSGDVVMLIGNTGTLSSFVAGNGTFRFDDVPEGHWVLGLIGTSEKNYDVRMIEVEAGNTLEIDVARTEGKDNLAMALKLASNGDVDPYKLWWFQVRSEAWKLYEKAVPLLSRKIPRPPYTAECLHNVEKYQNDVAQLNVFAMEIVSYLHAYGQTDAMLPIANASKLVGDASALVFWYIAKAVPGGKYYTEGLDRLNDFVETYGSGASSVGDALFRSQIADLNAFFKAVAKFSTMEINSLSDANAALDEALRIQKEGTKLAKAAAFMEFIEEKIDIATLKSFNEALEAIGVIAKHLQVLVDLYKVGESSGGYLAGVSNMRDKMADMQKTIARYDAISSMFGAYHDPCPDSEQPPMDTPPVDNKTPSVPKSCDPNEMVGDEGVGEARYVKPGDWMNYTIYFENKAGFDIADAQEIKVTNPLNEWLDWSTFEMREVAFNNQNDVGLDGLANGLREVQMTGTNKYVRTTVEMNADTGVATWYMRVYDPNGDEEGYPTDGSGFLPSNDDTHRGEGHLMYRIKVRKDAPANVVITNSASIVFDHNDPIETDPAWWNTVGVPDAQFAADEVVVNEGGTAEIRVNGGNADKASSVKVYLTYQTAAAADIDLKTGTVDGVAPKGGLKFPLTLSWAAGEIGEKVVTIPVKTDKTVEDDEFFTLQLAEPVGMELGDERVCTVTIRDMNDKALKAAVTAYKPKKGETVATNNVTVAAGDAKGGFVAGTGAYTRGSKLTLTAEARPGWSFAGWRLKNGDGTILSTKAKWQVVVTNDEDYVAVFEKIPYVRGLADPADGGKVAGSGLCDKGKKVTLKATANKNFTFMGWRRAEDAAVGSPMSDVENNNTEFVATTPTLVIDRSAKPTASSKTSTTITNVTGDVTYYAVFKSYPEVFVTVDATDGKGAEPTGKGAGKYVAGTITGMGKYAVGKTKIALKATANKGYVFAGWLDPDGELLTKDATYTIAAMGEEDVVYTAKFITAAEDKDSIKLSVDGEELSIAPTFTSARTNFCGVAMSWQLAADALSATKVKVSGLPAGLKFTDKPVTAKIGTGKTAVTVTNILANTIYGVPTAASKTDKKGNVTPSAVKFTVTTAGKSSQVFALNLYIDPLPAWAVGTFDGSVSGGDEPVGIVQAFTVATSGKISGKLLESGKTWALSANAFDAVEGPKFGAEGPTFFATVIGKAGKNVVTNEVTVTSENGIGVATSQPFNLSTFQPFNSEWTAYQNLWKRTDTKAEMPIFKKNFDVTLELGEAGDANNTVKLTFKKDGVVAFAGKVGGASVSGSSQLVWGENGWQVTLYAPPKGVFAGFCETFAVTLTTDVQNVVTDVVVKSYLTE